MHIIVGKSGPLSGEVDIPGAKNSVLGLLAASLLTENEIRIGNVPQILDVQIVCDILADLGVKIGYGKNELYLNSKSINHTNINKILSSKFRASYYFIGALLAKYKKVIIGYPGGDDFGSRPIDQHIKGLEALGATFTFYKDYYTVEAERLIGTEIYFDVISSGATINVMLASVLAKGKTILSNSARDPEVVDVANFLSKMGANIRGAGTDQIVIRGVKELKGCTYNVIPDRLIAGTFLIAAGMTKGKVTVRNVIPEHLKSFTIKLEEMGMEIETGENSITAFGKNYLRATRVKTGMYPMFATDLQQPITSLMLLAAGRSIVTDTVYPKRFRHVLELRKMGASIEKRNNTIFISGSQNLTGSVVQAHDVRAGSGLILAGLAAEGKTTITDIDHILRGYENVTEMFSQLGADIKLEKEIITESMNLA